MEARPRRRQGHAVPVALPKGEGWEETLTNGGCQGVGAARVMSLSWKIMSQFHQPGGATNVSVTGEAQSWKQSSLGEFRFLDKVHKGC
jgi:hypothetical protein